MATAIKPFWTVQTVFDPDVTGQDFAYTVGLASRGRPELHIWASPTEGADPGVGYRLSSNDMGGLLNQLATEWLAEEIEPGSVRSFDLDFGMTTLIATVGEPCDADSLEAFGARPALVAPIRWELRRPERREPAPLSRATRDQFTADIVGLEQRCGNAVQLRLAGTRNGPISFDLEQPYGPLSEWVRANARCLVNGVAPKILVAFICNEDHPDRCSLISLMELSSRVSSRDHLIPEIRKLADEVSQTISRTRAWRNAITSLDRAEGMSMSKAREEMDHFLLGFITSVLVGSALEDVLPLTFKLAALSTWQTALLFDLAA